MKRALLLLLGLLPLGEADAQVKGFYYQVRGGIGQSVFRPSSLENQTGLVSFSAGLGANYQFNPYVGIMLEGIWVRKGSRIRGSALSVQPLGKEEYEDRYRLYYVEFPLLLKFSAPLTDDFYLKVFGGPSLNLCLGGRYSRSYVNAGQSGIPEHSLQGLNGVEYAYVYGAGFDIKDSGYPIISIDVRTSHALNVSNTLRDEQNRSVAVYNRYFAIGIAYTF